MIKVIKKSKNSLAVDAIDEFLDWCVMNHWTRDSQGNWFNEIKEAGTLNTAQLYVIFTI